MTDQSIVDKTMRSVFVGNIPYEVSEEKLKDIFSEVGPVLSFKLVFDRDSGKPKGYGFCEYKDQETALSAMRNLNNYEIAGRNLRVDNACTEKSRLEMQSLMQSTQVESTYGEVVSPEKAPEAISKAIASIPPEQMYELVKQMKQCIQNNHEESRQLLLQNPQLAYALLQVMILMKVVDTASALSLLHPTNNVPAPLSIPSPTASTTSSNVVTSSSFSNSDSHPVSSTDSKSQFWSSSSNSRLSASLQNATSAPSMSNVGAMQPPPIPPMVGGQDMDMRAPSRFSDQDLRIPSVPSFPQVDMVKRDPRLQQMPDNMQTFQGLFPPPGMIPPPSIPLPMQIPLGSGNLPAMPPNMPRMVPPPSAMSLPIRTPQNSVNQPVIPNLTNASGLKGPLISAAGTDTEKANLIMQVLKLTDEQIAALPPEHRQSILTLKDQIAKSAVTR
ncbi:hypothetical protein V9T40_011536 [Parthenolecanium corni]|uniref:RRM domain-containing protein n=1 Tax=Parthenolecanium corni TaxID=536013 RepID=A0AAN9XZM8_9HEMI